MERGPHAIGVLAPSDDADGARQRRALIARRNRWRNRWRKGSNATEQPGRHPLPAYDVMDSTRQHGNGSPHERATAVCGQSSPLGAVAELAGPCLIPFIWQPAGLFLAQLLRRWLQVMGQRGTAAGFVSSGGGIVCEGRRRRDSVGLQLGGVEMAESDDVVVADDQDVSMDDADMDVVSIGAASSAAPVPMPSAATTLASLCQAFPVPDLERMWDAAAPSFSIDQLKLAMKELTGLQRYARARAVKLHKHLVDVANATNSPLQLGSHFQTVLICQWTNRMLQRKDTRNGWMS